MLILYPHPVLSDGNVFVVVTLHDKVPCVWEQLVHNTVRTRVMVWGKREVSVSQNRVGQFINQPINDEVNSQWSIDQSIDRLDEQSINQSGRGREGGGGEEGRGREGGGGEGGVRSTTPLLLSLDLDLSDFSVFSGFEEEWDSERK